MNSSTPNRYSTLRLFNYRERSIYTSLPYCSCFAEVLHRRLDIEGGHATI